MLNAEHDRGAYVKGLRDLATFFENHPNLPIDEGATFTFYSFGTDSLDLARHIATELGTFKKEVDYSFILEKQFGPIKLRYIFSREDVCTKTVVGKKMVEKSVPPPGTVLVTQQVEEDIVEWSCPQHLLGVIEGTAQEVAVDQPLVEDPLQRLLEPKSLDDDIPF